MMILLSLIQNQREVFCGDNADDTGPEVHIPNEGAQGPNFAADGEGRCRSQQRHDPIDRLVPTLRLFGNLMLMGS
jgi:hypothetical protein